MIMKNSTKIMFVSFYITSTYLLSLYALNNEAVQSVL